MNKRWQNRCTWSGLLSAVGLSLIGLAGCRVVADGENATGVKLFQAAQYEAAMQHFQKALARDPRNADAYYNMASTTHQLGKLRKNNELLQQAETLYNQCLDHNPEHPECHRGLAVLLVETGRSDKAFTLLKNWVIRSPESEDARIELARLYDEFGDRPSAQRQLEYALTINPKSARLLTALGYLREESGDLAQALINYRRALEINPQQPQVAARVATLQSRLGSSAPLSAGGTKTAAESWTPKF